MNKSKNVAGNYVTNSYNNRKLCLAAYNYNLLIDVLKITFCPFLKITGV